MKIVKFVLIGMLFLICMQLASALTASMGNARMVLRANVTEGETTIIEKSILVNNVNNFPIEIKIEPAPEFEKIFDVIDNNFILQPQESKDARFLIMLTSGGSYETKLYVKFYSADPAIGDSPVGLASNIIIFARGPVLEQPEEDLVNETIEQIPNETEEEAGLTEEETSNPEEEEGQTTAEQNQSQEETGAESTEGKANPIIGISIIAAIVAIGLLIFWLFTKKSQAKRKRK